MERVLNFLDRRLDKRFCHISPLHYLSGAAACRCHRLSCWGISALQGSFPASILVGVELRYFLFFCFKICHWFLDLFQQSVSVVSMPLSFYPGRYIYVFLPHQFKYCLDHSEDFTLCSTSG